MRKLLFAFVLGIASFAAFAQTKPLVKDFGAELPTSAAYIGNSFLLFQQRHARPCEFFGWSR
jgi:hypothetical protein